MHKLPWKPFWRYTLLLCLLAGSCQGSDAAPSASQLSSASPPSQAKQLAATLRRWYTVDASSPSELKRKQDYLARIDRFWIQFRKDQAQLSLSGTGKIDHAAWAQKYIKQVDPEIYYEFGPGDKAQETKLDFSCVGTDTLLPVVKELVARAPKIAGWTFAPYKRPTKLTAVEEMFKARGFKKATPQFRADFTANEFNIIDAVVGFSGATGDYTKDAETVLLLSDMILGEESSDIWLGELNAKKLATQKNFDYLQSAKDFSKAFYDKKKQMLATLPKVPYYKLKEFGTYGMFEFQNKDGRFSRRQTMSTSAQKLCSALSMGVRFHSERFSNFGEKFAYLQIPNAGVYVAPKERGKIEDALDSELRKAQLGCVFAAGFGKPDISYIDLCLVDVNRATPIIKKVCAQFNLSHKSNLRFYDCDWLYEWVKMFPDTPVPDDLGRPWFYRP